MARTAAARPSKIPLVAEVIRAAGYGLVVSCESGGTPIGDEVRQGIMDMKHEGEMHPATEILLFQALRAQLVNEVIHPARAPTRRSLTRATATRPTWRRRGKSCSSPPAGWMGF